MAILGNNLKTAFLKGMEAIGKGAANLTSSAQQKLSEINLDNRRGEILKEIPQCALKLWKDGVSLPEELNALLAELDKLNEQLAAMRAKPEPAAPAQEPQEAPETVEDAVDAVEDSFEEAADAVEEVVEAVVEDVKDAVEGFFKKDEEEPEAPAQDAE